MNTQFSPPPNRGDFKSFFHYAFPATVSMLLAGIYTLVDGFFVGWGVGSDGLAAINIAFPFYTLYLGLGEMLGNGSAITISYCRGRNKPLTAGLFFGNLLSVLIPLGIVLALLAPLTAPLVRYMGAPEIIVPQARNYALIIGLGAGFQITVSALIAVMRNDGKQYPAMGFMLLGLGANIILDYLMVIRWEWGVEGSAWATIASQGLTALLAVRVFIKGQLNFSFRFRHLRPYRDILGKIILTGLPSLGLQLMGALLILLHNIQAERYGALSAVAAYAIISYITAPVVLLNDGIALGIQPLVSFFHGSGEEQKQKRIFRFGIGSVELLALPALVGTIACAPFFPGWFNADAAVVPLAVQGLILAAVSFPAMGAFQVLCAYEQATGRSGLASFLIYADCLIAFPLALFVLPVFMGINGVWAALAVSKTLMLLLALAARRRK